MKCMYVKAYYLWNNVISLSDCGFTKVSSFTFCKKQVHTFLFHQSQNNFLKISENID